MHLYNLGNQSYTDLYIKNYVSVIENLTLPISSSQIPGLIFCTKLKISEDQKFLYVLLTVL